MCSNEKGLEKFCSITAFYNTNVYPHKIVVTFFEVTILASKPISYTPVVWAHHDFKPLIHTLKGE